MRTNKEIVKIAEGIYAEAMDNINNLALAKESIINGIVGKPVDEVIDTINDVIAGIEASVYSPRVDGVGLPAYLSKLTYEEGATEVTVGVRTKLKSAFKYRKDTVVAVDDEFVLNAGKAYVDALFDMFYIEEATANVQALNEKLAEIIAENEIPYGFRFEVNANTDAMILSINNTEVVFNASITRAQDIASLGIFKGGDEYNDLIYKESVDKLVASLKAVQTPVQLIKANIDIIKDITGISTKKRASKLIRGSYHRQAKYLGGVKTGVGYFEETVNINGEDIDVFALVAKSEDGEISLVLNPFDVKTLYNVDYDVVGAVKAQLA